MKLIASTLILSVFSSTAWAGRCDSAAKYIANDLWDMPSSPTSVSKTSTSYGHAKNASIEKLINREKEFKISWTFDKKSYEQRMNDKSFPRAEKKDFEKNWKIRNSREGVVESWTPPAGWIHPKDEYRTDALYGSRADVSDLANSTVIVKRGYVVKDTGFTEKTPYKTFKAVDDVRITLDESCKLTSIEYLRAKPPVKVTAAQCAWIRDYKIKDLEKNVSNELQPIIAKTFHADDYTHQRIMVSCRGKFGINTPSLVKLLPEKVRSDSATTSSSGSARKAQ